MDCDVVDERFMIKMAIVAVLAALGHYFCHYRLLENHHKYVFGKGGTNYIRKALSLDRELFRDVYRMYPEPFRKLCLIFKQKGLLKDTRYVTLEEQVAMTLIILAHGQRYSITREQFRRSVWTVSTYFNKVIDAILAIAKDYIKAPTNYLHPQISNDERFFPYFKDCIGAVDGTHVPAHILGKDQMRFWNRKGHITQNLLIACNFDLEFTYVLAGWEGSTADASLLKTALTSPSKRLLLPEGKYMLVDAGFANIPGFLAPFRKTRYHLKEFGTTPDRLPQTAQELFNHRHSSLRNAIERSFAVWKNRFEICKRPPMFPYKTQVKIVAATCVLHNFLRRENKEDIWDNDSDDDDEGDIAPILPSNTSIVDGTAMMGRFRDKLVKKMWDDRKRHEL